MMAAAATRGRERPLRRPFAPVVVSPPPPQAENRLEREEDAAPSSFARRVRRFGKVARPAVLGGGGGKAKAAKNRGGGSSPVCVSSKKKKTPAASVKRAPGSATRRRRLDSCTTKKCPTPAPAAAAGAVVAVAYDDDDDDEVRTEVSYHCSEADAAGQEERRRGSEASSAAASRMLAIEDALAGLPEHGEGRVKYLVDTFERLLSLRGGKGGGRGGPTARSREAARRRRMMDQGTATATVVSLPATPRGAEEIDVSCPSIASSSEVSFPGVACILEASDRTSRITRAARGQRRQRAHDSTGGSSDTTWSCSRKVTRVTTQQPFRLRTEQRGKAKEGNFLERMRKMQMEEERLRNPLAQGLPYTTDEPEIPAKPPTKEPTQPMDLVLHSDVRVVKRVKFDKQVAERNSFMEAVKLERERQRKVDEEIEIKQLRKEQVSRAHPMPDFSKPLVPKRSMKLPTIPRDPKFHTRSMKHISKA